MIKIEKEDSIIDILKKINSEKSNDIILDFPFWHPVLHNHLSLKIIQTKTRNKKLSIISNDKTAKKITKVLGIRFIKNKKENKVDQITTHKIIKENYTFLEYANLEIKLFFSKFIKLITWNLNNNVRINTIFYYKNKYWKNNKNIIGYFIVILTFIFLLLLYIYYIAINKTYITIFPETQLQTKSKNFTFIEKTEWNENTYYNSNNKVDINKITKKIVLSKKIWTSWIKQKNENISKWKVILYNYLNEKIYLLKNTTLQNKEWVQFYLPDNVTIPAAKIKNWKLIPWEKNKTIFWKIKLLNWDYSWLKTNIWTGVLLTIPKLWKNKIKIFAKSISKFNWWTNNFTKFLTKEDLINAKKLIKDEVKELAIKKIKEEIQKSNIKNNIKVELLPIDNIFKFTNLLIKTPDYIKVWDEIKDFTITAEVEINSYTYNKQAVISLLKNYINDRIVKDKEEIVSINEDDIRFSHIIKRNDLIKSNWKYKYLQKIQYPFLIKSTVEIEYYVSEKFNKNNSNYIKKIKHSIISKDIKDAENFLINKPEINNVHIKVQPFFMNKISKLPEKIEIIIENN